MGFNVFRGDVGQNRGLKADEAMPELFDALGGHLQDNEAAGGYAALGQEFLKLEPPGHGHFKKIGRLVIIYLETQGR